MYKEPEGDILLYRSRLPVGTLFIKNSDRFQEEPQVFMALINMDVDMSTGKTTYSKGLMRIRRVEATLTIEKIA